ncbi:hypothetical protein ACFX2J_026459 [Malus domestica]
MCGFHWLNNGWHEGLYALWGFRFSDDTSWNGRLCGMQSTVTKKQ